MKIYKKDYSSESCQHGRTLKLTTFDFENCEYVDVYEEEGTFEYTDTMTGNWNLGTFTVREEDGKCFVMTSSSALEAAVINALRFLYPAGVEWVEPKIRNRRTKK